MKSAADDKRLLILPVRRRLMTAAMAYLAGIFTTTVIIFPIKFIGILSMLFLVLAAVRLGRRKSVLFCVAALMLLAGNLRAGNELSRRDLPTSPGVMIEGTITRIEKPYRVYLGNVRVDGADAGYAHDVVVTLMLDEDDAQPEPPQTGQRVLGKGRLFAPDEARNPGGVDWRIQSICKGYELSGYILPGWTAQGNAVFSLRECMRALRAAINARISRLFGVQAAIFQGIMLGDKSALEDEVTAAMRLTGTAHVLTVSGLHLSMVAAVVGALLGTLPIRRKHRFVLLGGFLLFFTSLTGAAAGTIRACIMALMREWAIVRGRRYEPLTTLSLAALCMTLVQPLWLLNASFQFSFFVVLGIQLFSGSFSAFVTHKLKLHGVLSRTMNLLSLSLSAQIGSVPMQLMLYGYVSVLSLPMNAVMGAVMPFLLLGGWLAVLISMLWFEEGGALAQMLSLAAIVFEKGSLFAASLKGATLRLPAPHGATVLLLVLLFLLLTARIRLGPRRRMAALLAAAIIAGSYLIRFDPQARYVQLDVGQGDAAIFRRGRRAVLVDVGPTDSYEALRYLRHEGLFVDAVILSHLDEDHAGALSVLLASEVEIPAVVTGRGAKDQETSAAIVEALAQLEDSGVSLYEVQKGDRIDVNGVTFDVLSPDGELLGSNERSLLLYAVAESVSFLLTGDLPITSEPAFVPEADVLKVAHHGSRNSTSDSFARMASPAMALVSVGKNNGYGHPHARVLDALGDAQVLRTDERGCITLRLRDGAYDAQCFLNQ